jgi:hypothetical protein
MVIVEVCESAIIIFRAGRILPLLHLECIVLLVIIFHFLDLRTAVALVIPIAIKQRASLSMHIVTAVNLALITIAIGVVAVAGFDAIAPAFGVLVHVLTSLITQLSLLLGPVNVHEGKTPSCPGYCKVEEEDDCVCVGFTKDIVAWIDIHVLNILVCIVVYVDEPRQVVDDADRPNEEVRKHDDPQIAQIALAAQDRALLDYRLVFFLRYLSFDIRNVD